jgi:hypothetical protein
MTSQGTGNKSKASEMSLPGNELDHWLQAERELERPAPEEGESADQIYRRA